MENIITQIVSATSSVTGQSAATTSRESNDTAADVRTEPGNYESLS